MNDLAIILAFIEKAFDSNKSSIGDLRERLDSISKDLGGDLTDNASKLEDNIDNCHKKLEDLEKELPGKADIRDILELLGDNSKSLAELEQELQAYSSRNDSLTSELKGYDNMSELIMGRLDNITSRIDSLETIAKQLVEDRLESSARIREYLEKESL